MLSHNSPVRLKFVFVIMGSCLILIWLVTYLTGPTELVYGGEINENSQEVTQDPWISNWRKIIEQGQLYQYAIKLFNDPVDYEGKITDTFDGNKYGVTQFSFSGGGILKIETFPPESSITTLRVPNGFPNENDAGSFLKQYLRDIGLNIDWSKPKSRLPMTRRLLNFMTQLRGLTPPLLWPIKTINLLRLEFPRPYDQIIES